jgi:hypothetical protein
LPFVTRASTSGCLRFCAKWLASRGSCRGGT